MMLGFFSLNRKILSVYNTCDRDVFSALLEEVLALPEKQLRKIFTSKLYLWNIIRPRDFYKMSAYYVITSVKQQSKLDRIDILVHLILESTPDPKIRSSFVWNILKHCSLLTVDTIQYASPERIQNILQSDRPILADDALTPVVAEVLRLRNEIAMYQSLINE